MGSSGYKPFESDDSADLLYKFQDSLWKVLRAKKSDFIQIRGSVELFIALSKGLKYLEEDYMLDEELYKACIEKLHIILKDEEWIDNWNDPKEIKLDIRRQIRLLEKLGGLEHE
ncbi:MAG: hypothetical protein KGO96_07605 [Elusimicrobia bacterium]|nr:hypothetical protein [Elusimicrobiota bacterium]